jgi:hypothetical protein
MSSREKRALRLLASRPPAKPLYTVDVLPVELQALVARYGAGHTITRLVLGQYERMIAEGWQSSIPGLLSSVTWEYGGATSKTFAREKR